MHVLSVVPDAVSDGLRFDAVIKAPSGAGGDYLGWNGSASDAKALGFSTGQAVKAFDIEPGAIRTDLRIRYTVVKDKSTFTSRNVRVS